MEEKRVAVLALALILFFLTPTMSLAQEEGVLLIGYGGERFLPFLEGARYRFVVGERLFLKSIGSAIFVTLTTREGNVHSFQIDAGETEEVWRFRSEDIGAMTLAVIGSGGATLEVLSVEESALGWVDLKPVGAIRTGTGLEDVIEASIVGSSLSGFAPDREGARPTRIFARPNSTLRLQVPPDALGIRATLRHYDFIQLSGYINELHVRYRVEPIVAEYRFNDTLSSQTPRFIYLRIPPLGEVGEGGLVPVRYGTLVVHLFYSGRGGERFEEIFEVLVTPILEEPPPMSSSIKVSLSELLQRGLSIISANLTTGKFESKVLQIPHYRVRVYDTFLSEWVEDYSISFTGFLSFRNGSETITVQQTVPIGEWEPPPRITLQPTLTVYSVNVGETIGLVTLEAGRGSTVFVEGRKVNVEVRHAAGFLLGDAKVYVNGSFRGVGGRLSFKLPVGAYNFSAETQFGVVFKVSDIRDVQSISLVFRGYTAETLALITVFLIQLSVLAVYSWRWLKTTRRGSRLFRIFSEGIKK
ncbi:MAG: hypothetical protein RMJ28_02450 [Nitrososphaerota archaeon]|nr:hypothetical protein [Candidatus Calditenuaceae archaeon]MDW8073083.1 hypothetical protein [Nitrososphaerota archaeon]